MKLNKIHHLLPFFLSLIHVTSNNINTIVQTPDNMKQTLAPYLSAINPENRLPIGVNPANTSEYTLITLPLYSSTEFSCRVELAVVEKNILNMPVIAKLKAVR